MIEVIDQKIDVEGACASVLTERAGGVVHFVGTVRQDGDIEGLMYEAHSDMAKEVIRNIAEEAKQRWGLERVSVVHRYGWVPLGEAAVVVAVSAEHRKEAFEACQFIMSTIKHEAPIWKIGGQECCVC